MREGRGGRALGVSKGGASRKYLVEGARIGVLTHLRSLQVKDAGKRFYLEA